MKILFTNFHEGRGGGHDRYVLTLASMLASRHQITVAAPPASRLLELVRAVPGVTALPFPFPAKLKDLGRMLAAVRALRALLRRERYDVVHVNGSPDHRLLMFALMPLNAPRPYIVWTKHNSIPIKRDFITALRARRATDHVIAVSDSTRALVHESVYRHCALSVVKNGVDVDAFRPANPVEAAAARLALLGPARAGKLVIGSVTGFDWYKGTMDVLAAVAALPDPLREQVEVVVVGTAPNDAQQREIDRLGVRGQLTIVGFVEDVKSCIQTFDIGYVVSYAIETVSFACREMMAMGKPVIVTRYAGLPENVDNGVDGWIVPPHDPASLAQALDDILAHRARIDAMGAAARAKAIRAFSSEQFVAQTEAVYQRCPGSRPAQKP